MDEPAYEPHYFGSRERLTQRMMLDAPIRTLPRPSKLQRDLVITPKRAALGAEEMGIRTVEDMFWHLPHRHEDRREVTLIKDLREEGKVTVAGYVRSIRPRPTRKKGFSIIEAMIADGSVGERVGELKVVWFNRPWMLKQIKRNDSLLIYGSFKKRQIVVDEVEIGVSQASDAMTPVYPANDKITPLKLREIALSLRGEERNFPEILPARLRTRLGLIPRADAFAAMHFPVSEAGSEAGRVRLAFDELLMWELLLMRRRQERSEHPAEAFPARGKMVTRWLTEQLPFTLTDDQQNAIIDIEKDLKSERPMQRLLMGEVGSGKSMPLYSKILTPEGFKTMGDMKVGMKIANPTGESSVVTGVYPQGARDIYRVTFADKSSAECDGEHLWQVRTSCARHRNEPHKVMTLNEIRNDFTKKNGSPKWQVELPKPIEMEGGEDRPVDPYLLGMLLGDGSLTKDLRFTTADPELIQEVDKRAHTGCEVVESFTKTSPYDWRIVGKQDPGVEELKRITLEDSQSLVTAYQAGASVTTIAKYVDLPRPRIAELIRTCTPIRKAAFYNPLMEELRSLDLMGKGSYDKFVPLAYLNAPIKVRHAVLQGLLDTDGTLDSRTGYNISFTSASHQLASDVAWLTRSLGGRAVPRPQIKVGNTYWYVSVILPAEFPPFRLKRKAELLKPRSKYAYPAKAITAIEYVGKHPAQCISVSHPNQLYITDDFTITHNTIVAAYSMLRAAESGMQATMMAPTETLAEQHFITLQKLLGEEMISMALLTGSTTASDRKRILGQLASGELKLIVGTHALLEPGVQFDRLGVAVIDEQHRFGVRQRALLDSKGHAGAAPHLLHMSATPIPRTLALTVYGDLDTTALHTRPAARPPVETFVVSSKVARARVWERLRAELDQGRQAFVVCPLVEESEALSARAASVEYELLQVGELAAYRVGLIHGRMSSADKQAVMERMHSRELDVLVATSVIEVGIDVPNATVMVIEDADRYGISQLHQLRGRVGRGDHAALCFLMGPKNNRRLQALAKYSDGFTLSELDLEIRGEGEMMGTRQSGMAGFRVARLESDLAIVEMARAEAEALAESDPLLENPDYEFLREAIANSMGAVA